MDVLNKLKSAVTSALPGNPLSREFDVAAQVGSCGTGLLWKIYNGVKKSTKQEVAIFEFEKKLLERYSRRDRELILDTVKKGAAQLTRLRHPKILSVLHPMEESRESLAFATEPVFASLANVLGCHENLPTLPKDLQEYKLYEVEIKYGLLQVTEALSFLHNDVKLLHNGVCPESVVINKSGSWKLTSFDFCCPNCNQQDQIPSFDFKEWDPELPPVCQPNLNYLAPEYAITMACSLASDMFSMGVLITALFNNGKPLYECNNQLSLFKKYTEELRKFRSSLIGNVPEEVKEYVKLLLNTEPSVRPDPAQLSKLHFFEDVGSMTLQYMDNLFQQNNLQKSKFFKGLPKIISKLPKRVNIQRILPAMLKECVNVDMIPFILPNILLIAEQSSDKEYVNIIMPVLIPLFKIKEPIQILLIFLQNMNLLLSKTPQNDIKTHVLPMIYRSLEAESPQIQELCLDIIPTFAELIEYQSLKTSIVPRIKKLCLSTSTLAISRGQLFGSEDVIVVSPREVTRYPVFRPVLSVKHKNIPEDLLNKEWECSPRAFWSNSPPFTSAEVGCTGPNGPNSVIRVNCLVCLGKLLEHMDKWSVLDDVLPILAEIPSREPAVMMGILGIYQVALTHDKLGITKDLLATKVLPFLITLSIDHNLNLRQFNAYISVVKDMIQRVEVEHRGKLEQLDQMKQEQKTLEITKLTGQDDGQLIKGVEDDKPQTMMDKFLTGFGISRLIGDANKAGTQTGASPSGEKLTESKPEVRHGGQPAKVLLSLEEKQRLAKEQENQVRFKNQKTLKPSAQTNRSTFTGNSTNKSGTKDLTSSLMNSNIMGLQTSAGKSSGHLSNPCTSMSHAGPPVGVRTNMSSGQQHFIPGPQPKTIDLSTFDNLLSSSKQPPRSLNQLAQQNSQQTSQFAPGFSQNQHMGMVDNTGNVNRGMMGNVSSGQSMMGMPRTSMNFGFGAQGPGINLNQGMNNQTAMGMFESQQMWQNTAPQQNVQSPSVKQTNSASNDLADIFG